MPSFVRGYVRRLENSPTGHRLATGAFWSLSGAMISRALGLAASVFVARVLGKESFGALGIIQSTVGMFQIFAGFGLGLTATKYVAEFRRSDPAKAGRVIGLSTIVATSTGLLMLLALVILAPWLAKHTLAQPSLAFPLRLSAVMLLLGALIGAQTGALAGFEEFKTIARINLFAGLANFPLMLIAVYYAGLPGAIVALTAGMGVNWLLNHFALRSAIRKADISISFSDAGEELKVLWRFSTPAVLGGLMVGPATWICNAMLVNRAGGYGEMGVFNAANQWRGAILFLPNVLAAIILPVLSNLRGEGDRPRYKKVLLYNIWFNGGVTLCVALVISLAAPLIMSSYGVGFREHYLVLVFLSLSAVLNATIGVIGQAIASEDRMWAGTFLNLLWACALVAATWFLIGYGAVGLAIAVLLAYALHLFTVGAYSYYILFKFPAEGAA
jgi:O-antigen/teichoic acid export membrane protein